MTPMNKIELEPFPPPDVEPGAPFGAYISDVKDPHDFYLQLKSSEASITDMLNSLATFYKTHKDTEKYEITGLIPGIVGLPIAALYFNERGKNDGWHRGIITAILDLHTIKVFYMDYGTTGSISISYCR